MHKVTIEEHESQERKAKLNGGGDSIAFASRLDEIGRMPRTEYLSQRKNLAKELGIPCSLLDDEHRRREKKEGDTAVMQAHWNVEPWHGPVSGRELVGEIESW